MIIYLFCESVHANFIALRHLDALKLLSQLVEVDCVGCFLRVVHLDCKSYPSKFSLDLILNLQLFHNHVMQTVF